MANYKAVLKTLQKSYSYIDKILVLEHSGKIEFSTENWNVKGDIDGLLSNWASGNAQFVMVDGVKYSILQMEPERFVGTNRHNKGHLIGATTDDRDKYLIAHVTNKAKGWMHKAYPTVARAAVALKDESKLKHLDGSARTSGKGKGKKEKKILKKIKKAEKKYKKYVKKDKKEKAIKYGRRIIAMATSIENNQILDKYQGKIDTLLGKKTKGEEGGSSDKPVNTLLHTLNVTEGEGEEESTPEAPQPREDPVIRKEVESFLIWTENLDGLASYVKYYLERNDFRVISDLSKIYNNIRNILGA